MKKGIGLVFLWICLVVQLAAQRSGFYTEGYILYAGDTTRCKIWFNPDTPYFHNDINVWMNGEAKIMPFEKDNNLDGFGITQKEYEAHFGKIRLQGLHGWDYRYAPKRVTGPVELYEYSYILLTRKENSFALQRIKSSAYFIARTSQGKSELPTLLKSLKKKKIEPFLPGFPGLKPAASELSPDQLTELIKQYNAWYLENEKKS